MTDISHTLSALADPTRRCVFERLVEGKASVAEITRGLPVSQPAVSQHLKVLREAGLVAGTPKGASTIYQIDPAGLLPLRAWLDRFWDEQLAAFAKAAEEEK
ncbi:ArsR/SmtB family transcription factor [Tabrizicola sp.]|uniref:ArsR/SmtB family transcription factor n=1 Tax=Tabrizicola sp. TaxID=2005166 RepID=UPI003F2AF2DC